MAAGFTAGVTVGVTVWGGESLSSSLWETLRGPRREALAVWLAGCGCDCYRLWLSGWLWPQRVVKGGGGCWGGEQQRAAAPYSGTHRPRPSSPARFPLLPTRPQSAVSVGWRRTCETPTQVVGP